MFKSTTPQAIIDDVLAITDNDGYNLVSTTQLCAWINNELTTLWQWAKLVNRDAFTKCTAQFSITSGNTKSMVATAPTGLGLTDWSTPRGVDCLIDTDNWKKIRTWNFSARDRVGLLAYKFMGETLYILPTSQASQYPFRVWYVFSAPQVSSAALSTAFSIPDGADEYIKQGVAAKLRIRRDESPNEHMQLQLLAKAAIQADLASARGDQGRIADVSEDMGPELW
jgi:hypothetical protein